jgi:hypothetical protein
VLQRLLLLVLLSLAADVQAQSTGRGVIGVDVQKLVNGVLGVMSYTIAPDVTTSSLAISNAATSTTNLDLTQFGGGFTWSKDTPLYLEGNAAYSRYDPKFVASDGTQTRALPVKWNSVSGTGGIGWDFPISEHWVIRPIFNFSLGYVASDVEVAKWWIDNNTDVDLSWLNGGKMRAYGLGGSLMFDYELFSPSHDDDLELRYTNVELHNYGDTSVAVQGHATAESVSIYARRRIPTGWGTFWNRPIRYVFEGAFTKFLGNENDVGLSHMSSVGVGLELDTSDKSIWVTRARAVLRYKFGPDVRGYAIGLAVSF